MATVADGDGIGNPDNKGSPFWGTQSDALIVIEINGGDIQNVDSGGAGIGLRIFEGGNGSQRVAIGCRTQKLGVGQAGDQIAEDKPVFLGRSLDTERPCA